MAEVKFCENNVNEFTEEVVEKVKNELEGTTVEVESCLGYCGECVASPYALVDDEFVQADTADELFDKIKEAVQ